MHRSLQQARPGRKLRLQLSRPFVEETKDTSASARLAKVDDTHAGDASQDALAAALFDYAALADQHADQIAGLGGFDVKLVSEARVIAQALREQSAGSTVTTTETALELRNRLASLLYDRMQRVRTAARFVFRGHPALIRQVTSSYARRQRTAHRKAAVTPATPAAAPTNGASAPSPSTTVANH